MKFQINFNEQSIGFITIFHTLQYICQTSKPLSISSHFEWNFVVKNDKNRSKFLNGKSLSKSVIQTILGIKNSIIPFRTVLCH